ncbi:hypothetical protein CFBP6411_03380 [Pseudomonas syringae group genomosp. 3]|uniref:N-acetyltransferase domain-containing protein n=1 Tax=Pseudomonas syringae group genomosp. 3 TaxID=251701 RepID=A0A2K4WFQ5_9PSED|nr:GNAT family N-acetyltransferase [Pseudomonas syringae group genomosp. 3]SOS34737.1 hypothetical protein CFBP6411_03380 [Pseudomonas syringae group genomosp. 3]
MQTSQLPIVANPAIHADELYSADAAELQNFFDLNSEYFLICHGEPARPDEAATELELKIPDGLACNRQWFIGFREQGVGLIAVEHIIQDLFIEGVWHIGLLILEGCRHGKGDAQLIYAATEHWAVTQGARWLRIGVVTDNLRAKRFWESQGFAKVCERRGVAMGLKKNTIITMIKTLSGTTIPQYLELVERDRT